MTAVIYWSGTGNTEAMAQAIAIGMQAKGEAVELFTVDTVDASIVDGYEKLAFGCPSMGDEVLEEDEFEPFFTAVEKKLTGKKIALFGSYGWGDGEWMRNWQERVGSSGASLYAEGFIQNETPNEDECQAFGEGFAAF